jgi:CBS domain-containing protein
VVDLMFKNNLLEIPVVDVQGVLIGELFIEDLFRMGLPDYLFRMGDVSFLTNFEPFSELLREESKKSVGDVMSAPTGQIEPDTHAIQAALLLVKRDIRSLIVIEGGTPVGIVSLFDFIEKVLRA